MSATRLVASPVLAASDVDSARFGVSIARSYAASAADVTAISRDARASGVAMVIVRCPAGDLSAAQALEQAGGRLCDTLVHYGRPLDRPIPEQPRPVRRARPSDIEEIQAIAAGAFAGYQGHYQADPRLDRAAADEGAIAGFLTMEPSDDGTEIVLNGIRPDTQGRGLYAALVIGALRRSAKLKAPRCTVSTQVWNVRAQKVWIRVGFEPTQAVHTFHLWSD
jgi:GNAT superfamily N-acetyltransferase